ncbi:unnamed protein product [Schistocephalus solidus]|uniref:Uncharacterized protein n=1 Tax=Schistocephalus solidus TaxID=70667 RepID=A0A183SUQ9_SCHSO|nr:unnamed protein product [Schistocephalus solidus]
MNSRCWPAIVRVKTPSKIAALELKPFYLSRCSLRLGFNSPLILAKPIIVRHCFLLLPQLAPQSHLSDFQDVDASSRAPFRSPGESLNASIPTTPIPDILVFSSLSPPARYHTQLLAFIARNSVSGVFVLPLQNLLVVYTLDCLFGRPY